VHQRTGVVVMWSKVRNKLRWLYPATTEVFWTILDCITLGFYFLRYATQVKVHHDGTYTIPKGLLPLFGMEQSQQGNSSNDNSSGGIDDGLAAAATGVNGGARISLQQLQFRYKLLQQRHVQFKREREQVNNGNNNNQQVPSIDEKEARDVKQSSQLRPQSPPSASPSSSSTSTLSPSDAAATIREQKHRAATIAALALLPTPPPIVRAPRSWWIMTWTQRLDYIFDNSIMAMILTMIWTAKYSFDSMAYNGGDYQSSQSLCTMVIWLLITSIYIVVAVARASYDAYMTIIRRYFPAKAQAMAAAAAAIITQQQALKESKHMAILTAAAKRHGLPMPQPEIVDHDETLTGMIRIFCTHGVMVWGSMFATLCTIFTIPSNHPTNTIYLVATLYSCWYILWLLVSRSCQSRSYLG
jgi:hypothetical protein